MALFWIIGGCLFLSALSSYIFIPVFLWDLISHFPVYGVIASGAFLAFLIAVGLFTPERVLIAVVLTSFAFVLNVLTLLPLFYPAPKPLNAGAKTQTMMAANLFKFNTQSNVFVDLVNEKEPDILVLSEVTSDWDKALRAIEERYPYVILSPEEGSRGMSVYSKLPFKNGRVEFMSEGTVQSMIMDFDDFTLISGHPPPPMTQAAFEIRNQHFDWMEDFVEKRDHKKPLIIAGDFNITPFAARYKYFERRTGLQNAVYGRGVKNTWRPIFKPDYATDGSMWLGLPIDHFIVNDHVNIHRYEVLPDVGSDHRPILTEFSISQQ